MKGKLDALLRFASLRFVSLMIEKSRRYFGFYNQARHTIRAPAGH